MTLEEKVRYITSKHPDFAKRTIRDEDSHGNIFFDMILEESLNAAHSFGKRQRLCALGRHYR